MCGIVGTPLWVKPLMIVLLILIPLAFAAWFTDQIMKAVEWLWDYVFW